MDLTLTVIVGVLLIISATFFWVKWTNCRHVRLKVGPAELEIDRNDEPKPKPKPKPRRRRLPPGRRDSGG